MEKCLKKKEYHVKISTGKKLHKKQTNTHKKLKVSITGIKWIRNLAGKISLENLLDAPFFRDILKILICSCRA